MHIGLIDFMVSWKLGRRKYFLFAIVLILIIAGVIYARNNPLALYQRLIDGHWRPSWFTPIYNPAKYISPLTLKISDKQDDDIIDWAWVKVQLKNYLIK